MSEYRYRYIHEVVNSGQMGLKSDVLATASKVGIAQALLRTHDLLSGSTGVIRTEPTSSVRNFQLTEANRDGFVLMPLIPGYSTLCLRFCVLGHAFRMNGYEPIILRDAQDLPARPELTIESDDRQPMVEMCRYRSKYIPSQFGLKTTTVGDVLGRDHQTPDISAMPPSELKSYSHNGINVAKYAKASTRKYLKRYSLQMRDGDVRNAYERFLRAGIMLADATHEIIQEYDPTLTLVNEPPYIQGGIPLEVADRKGIAGYTQGQGYQQGELAFGRNSNETPQWNFSDEKITKRVVETPLTMAQQSRIDELMTGRETGDASRIDHTSNTELSVDVSAENLVGIFSHLLWDAALEPEQAIYDDFYGWLSETIEVGSKIDDTHFVIKAHPAESIRGTNESVINWLENEHSPLPANFSVLPPDTDVNTYELLRDLDAGVVYASTVGLEMVYNGIPVIVGGYPPYSGLDITYDPSNRPKYREMLTNIGKLHCGETMKKRAQRFAYFLFICKHLRFPYLTKHEGGDGAIEITHSDFTGDSNPYQTMVRKIIDEEEVLSENCPT